MRHTSRPYQKLRSYRPLWRRRPHRRSNSSALSLQEQPLRAPGGAPITWRGRVYSSISEGVCALLLERFIADFTVVPGISYQVAIGGGRTADFLVHNTVLEFHPVRDPIHGGIGLLHPEAFEKFIRRSKLSERDAAQLRHLHAIASAEARRAYFEKRRRALDEHPTFRELPLVVVSTPVELHQFIADKEHHDLPQRPEFCSLFHSLTEVAKRESVIVSGDDK